MNASISWPDTQQTRRAPEEKAPSFILMSALRFKCFSVFNQIMLQDKSHIFGIFLYSATSLSL